MKRNTSVLQFVCLFAATVAQAQSRPSEAKQILPLLQEQRVAANAHDTDSFLATFLHDASLVFVINGEVIHGFDNLHVQQLKWWNGGKGGATYIEQAPPDFISFNSRTVLVTQQPRRARRGCGLLTWIHPTCVPHCPCPDTPTVAGRLARSRSATRSCETFAG